MPALCSKSLSMYVWESTNDVYTGLLGIRELFPGAAFQSFNGGVAVPIGLYQIKIYNNSHNPPTFNANSGAPSGPCHYFWCTTGGDRGDCPLASKVNIYNITLSQSIGDLIGYSLKAASSLTLQADTLNATIAANPLLQFVLNTPSWIGATWPAEPAQTCLNGTCPDANYTGGTGIDLQLVRIGKLCGT